MSRHDFLLLAEQRQVRCFDVTPSLSFSHTHTPPQATLPCFYTYTLVSFPVQIRSTHVHHQNAAREAHTLTRMVSCTVYELFRVWSATVIVCFDNSATFVMSALHTAYLTKGAATSPNVTRCCTSNKATYKRTKRLSSVKPCCRMQGTRDNCTVFNSDNQHCQILTTTFLINLKNGPRMPRLDCATTACCGHDSWQTERCRISEIPDGEATSAGPLLPCTAPQVSFGRTSYPSKTACTIAVPTHPDSTREVRVNRQCLIMIAYKQRVGRENLF